MSVSQITQLLVRRIAFKHSYISCTIKECKFLSHQVTVEESCLQVCEVARQKGRKGDHKYLFIFSKSFIFPKRYNMNLHSPGQHEHLVHFEYLIFLIIKINIIRAMRMTSILGPFNTRKISKQLPLSTLLISGYCLVYHKFSS